MTVHGTEFAVDESRAVWVPAGTPHSARFAPGFCGLLRNTHGEAASSEALPLFVGESLRQALLASEWEDNNISEVITRELAQLSDTADAAALTFVEPRGVLTSAVALALLSDPADARTLDEWATQLHTSAVSLRRAFRSETGLAFSEWRTRVRLNAAVDRLALGEPVSAVAHAVGFSHNGLLAAFHRHLNCAPSTIYRRPRTESAETKRYNARLS